MATSSPHTGASLADRAYAPRGVRGLGVAAGDARQTSPEVESWGALPGTGGGAGGAAGGAGGGGAGGGGEEQGAPEQGQQGQMGSILRMPPAPQRLGGSIQKLAPLGSLASLLNYQETVMADDDWVMGSTAAQDTYGDKWIENKPPIYPVPNPAPTGQIAAGEHRFAQSADRTERGRLDQHGAVSIV